MRTWLFGVTSTEQTLSIRASPSTKSSYERESMPYPLTSLFICMALYSILFG